MYLVCGWCLDIFWRGSMAVALLLDTSSLYSVSPRSQSATPFHVLMCLEPVCILNCLQLSMQLQRKMGFFQKSCFAIPLHPSFPFPSPSILLTSPDSLQTRCFIFLSMDMHLICLNISHHFIGQNLKHNKQKHLQVISQKSFMSISNQETPNLLNYSKDTHF